EFGLMVSAGSDFHAPADWSELGMYRPLPEDLPPLWARFSQPLYPQNREPQ
ncbi:MAG TPA: phosphatase, partial [Pseudomonas oryzihabitans]|nr:phosphatase [Pseudomonas oryzihabitans]